MTCRRAVPRVLIVAGLLAIVLSVLTAPAALAVTYRNCSGLPLEPGADLHRCNFAGSNTLNGHNLTGANLIRSNLTNAKVGGNPDVSTHLSGAILRHVAGSGADMSDIGLSNADMRYADFSGASFESSGMNGAQLGNANLRGATFFFTGMSNVTMRNANLTDGSLRYAYLDGADLRYATLTRADLEGADFTNADLRNARGVATANVTDVVWSNTRCPDGTNSDANGGTCRGHLRP